MADSRILFIVGSAEKGKTGVGDYARRLASECVRRGGAACVLAVKDASVALVHPQSATIGIAEPEGEVRIHRFQSLRDADNFARIQDVIRSFRPDWISLQFAPYSYARWGLLASSGRLLAGLLRNVAIHVMAHELWIGECRGDSLKVRVMGRLQKILALAFLRKISFNRIHTSNPVYLAMLKENGIGAEILPLFGNIPILEKLDASRVAFCIFGGREKKPEELLKECLILVVFGTIHREWDPQVMLRDISQRASPTRRRVIVVFAGRLGKGEDRMRTISAEMGDLIDFVFADEQDEAFLSSLFQVAQCGLSTSPWALVEKSGAAAAMLEHGLPVIVTRTEWERRNKVSPDPAPHPLLYRWQPELTERVVVGLPRGKPASRVALVADRFLASLGPAESSAR